METTSDLRVENYLRAVADEIDDLPRSDRDDLLPEIREHLDHIALETSSPLEARLGSPQSYAAELRTSAGLPPRTTSSLARLWQRAWLALAAMRRRPAVAAAISFTTSVRAVWWVARAWLAVCAIAVATRGSWNAWSDRLSFVPRLGSGWLGLFVLLAAVLVSVQLGRVAWGTGMRRTLVTVNVLLVLAAVPVLQSLRLTTAHEIEAQNSVAVQYHEMPPQTGVFAAGNPVRNLYAYDGQGRLLTDVRLYTDAGAPLDLQLGQDPSRRTIFDVSGRAVENSYPIRYFEPGTRTVANPAAAPEVLAPPLVPAPMKPAQTGTSGTDSTRLVPQPAMAPAP